MHYVNGGFGGGCGDETAEWHDVQEKLDDTIIFSGRDKLQIQKFFHIPKMMGVCCDDFKRLYCPVGMMRFVSVSVATLEV